MKTIEIRGIGVITVEQARAAGLLPEQREERNSRAIAILRAAYAAARTPVVREHHRRGLLLLGAKP